MAAVFRPWTTDSEDLPSLRRETTKGEPQRSPTITFLPGEPFLLLTRRWGSRLAELRRQRLGFRAGAVAEICNKGQWRNWGYAEGRSLHRIPGGFLSELICTCRGPTELTGGRRCWNPDPARAETLLNTLGTQLRPCPK